METAISRRQVLAASLATVAGASLATADGGETTVQGPIQLGNAVLGKPVALDATNMSHAVHVSPDGLATTVLFGKKAGEEKGKDRWADEERNEGLSIQLGETDEPMTRTGAAEVVVPQKIAPQAGPFFYFVVVRGYVDKDPGTRIGLAVSTCGTTHVHEFPFGTTFSDDFERALSVRPPRIAKPVATACGGTARSCELLELPQLLVGFYLSMERAQPTDRGLIVIDSLDIEVRRAQQACVTRRRRRCRW